MRPSRSLSRWAALLDRTLVLPHLLGRGSGGGSSSGGSGGSGGLPRAAFGRAYDLDRARAGVSRVELIEIDRFAQLGIVPERLLQLRTRAASGGSGSGSSGGAAASLNNRKEWAVREDQLIWRGVQQIGCKWRQIAAMLPGRSDDAVRNRYNRLKEAEASGLVRSDSGEPTEAHAAGTLSGGGGGGGGGTGTYRCSKCGQLKKNHVCTAIGTGDARPKSDDKRRPERVGWTKAEDAIITHSVQELGHRWYQIAERLPGRTDHAIRNRWHRLLTMRQEEEARAQACGRSAAPSSAPLPMPGAEVMDSDAAADSAGASMATEEVVPPLFAPTEPEHRHSPPLSAPPSADLTFARKPKPNYRCLHWFHPRHRRRRASTWPRSLLWSAQRPQGRQAPPWTLRVECR